MNSGFLIWCCPVLSGVSGLDLLDTKSKVRLCRIDPCGPIWPFPEEAMRSESFSAPSNNNNTHTDHHPHWPFTHTERREESFGEQGEIERAVDQNLDGTSLDSPTRYSPSPSNPWIYLSLDPLITWVDGGSSRGNNPLQKCKEVKVEKLVGTRFLVKVTCKTGKDVLVSILEAFEDMKLSVIQARVTSKYFYGMEAIVEVENEVNLDVKVLTKALQMAIHKKNIEKP
ncbi:putative LRR receptor-like serine/threonine-protein kinase-like isoform 1 [Capsicum annuum]|nr:putative LRR receptor-like serine/threonine-protein kinase-like isoform 1 [Capsicum annuum]